MKSCDVLLVLGADFPYRQFFPEDAKIAQVDVRPEALGNRCPLEIGVLGSVKETLKTLMPQLGEKPDRAVPRSTNRRAPISTHSPKASRAAPRSTRNMSPDWSASWRRTTQSSPAMSARRSPGRRAISRSTACAASSDHLTTARWRMRCCTPSARKPRFRNARSYRFPVTAASA